MEEPPADEDPPLDGDEEELGDEGEEEAADDENEDANADPSGGAAGGGKRRLRRRLRADELNLLKAPMDVIVELTEATLEELADNRKLHQLRYPTYLVFTHPNFQLRATDGLRAIKGTALKARAAARAARAAPPPRRRRAAAATLRPAPPPGARPVGQQADGARRPRAVQHAQGAARRAQPDHRGDDREAAAAEDPRPLAQQARWPARPVPAVPLEPGSAAAHHPPPHGRRRCRSAAAAARARPKARATRSLRRRQVRLQGAHLCRLFAQRESPLPHNPKPHAAGRAPPQGADSQPPTATRSTSPPVCADDREPSRLGRAPPRTRPAPPRPAPRRPAPPRPASSQPASGRGARRRRRATAGRTSRTPRCSSSRRSS